MTRQKAKHELYLTFNMHMYEQGRRKGYGTVDKRGGDTVGGRHPGHAGYFGGVRLAAGLAGVARVASALALTMGVGVFKGAR